VLRRLIDRVADQFPILRDVAVKEHRGGLPTMTADGEHVVGPVPGVEGFLRRRRMLRRGLAIAPIVGEAAGGVDRFRRAADRPVAASPARLAVQSTAEAELREKCRRQYAFHYWSEASLP
jgi:hypothetical protein